MHMRSAPQEHFFRAGDFVRVRTEDEIRQTLDEKGELDGMPFMEEMRPFCGQRFRVVQRIEKTCYETPKMEMREFTQNDVVFLENVRCSGQSHGGCQIGCMIFWRSAWLEPAKTTVNGSTTVNQNGPTPDANGTNGFANGRTTEEGIYTCQATALRDSTRFLNQSARLAKCATDVQVGNVGVVEMAGKVIGPILRKMQRKACGDWPKGKLTSTPAETLNLQAGEWVEVKPMAEIMETLDENGKNRGLHFSIDMSWFCEKRFRVRTRLDRMILESTGKMVGMKNTVILDGINCLCPFTLGGCPRNSFQYWREIWLRRVDGPA